MSNTRNRRPGIGQAIGAVAGLATVTAVKLTEVTEKSFNITSKGLDTVDGVADMGVIVVDLAKQGLKLTGDGWLENLKIDNKVDKAFSTLELVKAEIEVETLLQEAKDLKASTTKK